MGDYYISWKRKGVGIYQRTYSYRNKPPKGAVSRTSLALNREEQLEQNPSVLSKSQLYSDLYAEAGNGETYNPEDTGHEFITQVWKCRRYDGPFFWYNDEYSWYKKLPRQGWISLCPSELIDYAGWGIRQESYGGVLESDYSDEDRKELNGAIGGSIQDILWTQCPDDIKGSLGQDVVDVVDFGKQLDKLITLQRRGVSLYRQYLQFSAKHKHRIDELVSKIRNSPRKGLKSLASHASHGYLTWIFQYLPWLDDLRTVLRVALSSYLRTVGRTRQRTIRNFTKTVDQLIDHDDNQGWLYFQPELEKCDPHSIPSKEAYDGTLFVGGDGSQDILGNVIYRVSASVVSVWQTTFEHGAAEPLYELNQQLGLVYPSLVWDLIPWTWLIDWFVNVGKFIDRAWERGYGEWNCSYAYVTTKLAATYAGMSYFQTSRWHISPQNGLGRMKSDQLSPSQWSILTALGLSHRN